MESKVAVSGFPVHIYPGTRYLGTYNVTHTTSNSRRIIAPLDEPVLPQSPPNRRIFPSFIMRWHESCSSARSAMQVFPFQTMVHQTEKYQPKKCIFCLQQIVPVML